MYFKRFTYDGKDFAISYVRLITWDPSREQSSTLLSSFRKYAIHNIPTYETHQYAMFPLSLF